MALCSIEGPMGSGKSGILAYLGYKDYLKGRKIYSNFHVNFPYTPFNEEIFYRMIDEDFDLNNCHILADEGYVYMDSRTSMSRLNRAVNYYSVQTRKRNVDLSITTHMYTRLDRRIREAVTVRIACTYQKPIYLGVKTTVTGKSKYIPYRQRPGEKLVIDSKGEKIYYRKPAYRFKYWNLETGRPAKPKSLPVNEIRRLYNTNEVVAPPKEVIGKKK